jgi:hypothetical protein
LQWDPRERLGEPVGQQQHIELAGVAVVEADHEFAAVGTEPLQRMRLACRKIPEAALVAIDVEDRRTATAVGHDRPLGRLVAVQLSDATGRQSLVDARNRIRNREIGLRHLACPAVILDALWRIVE